MEIREFWLVEYCLWYTVIVVIGTCCSFFSSSATEGSSERPGKVDSYLMSSISKAATPKVCSDLGEWLPPGASGRKHQGRFEISPPIAFWVFEKPYSEINYAAEILGWSQWATFSTHSKIESLQSPVQLDLGIPLSFQKGRWFCPFIA